MGKKRENFARFGMVAKGMVYALIGALTTLAAFNLGGSRSGQSTVLEFLARQPYGMVLLIVIAVGLFGYAFFRCYEAFYNTEEGWNELKGAVKRIGFLVSAIFYGALGVSATTMVISSNSNAGDTPYIQQLLDTPYGNYIIAFIALCILGKGLFQFYKAYSKKFKEEVQESSLSRKAQKVLIRAGVIGFSARGVVSSIVAYLLFKVSLGSKDSMDGKVEAFNFLQNTFGAAVMGIVALGLVSYGIFMFIQAKYPKVSID
ncbi:DUF1206 domain-containing protein [Altibacter sp. HG106]|uniref:DUF1206 domain-containing protein n=1 Tax=Altibacter sp. HG106 TaxID=3023937 RepID=UPI002350790A|nr:DUF1206 domain-containing protein [Altibacter sp. HG106]MDC7994088.1 DUF1206 domain-containing protein [Altibacter sp. HG106]